MQRRRFTYLTTGSLPRVSLTIVIFFTDRSNRSRVLRPFETTDDRVTGALGVTENFSVISSAVSGLVYIFILLTRPFSELLVPKLLLHA